MNYKLLFIAIVILLQLSCKENRQRYALSNVTFDTVHLDSKSWIIRGQETEKKYKKKFEKGFADINIFGFKVSGEYLRQDSIFYLKNDEEEYIRFLDFRLIGCNSYRTIYGNSMRLLNFFHNTEDNDTYFFYLFKMPYSIMDDPNSKDRFIIYASQKKGVIGASDFYQDSTIIRVYDYKGEVLPLIDSTFENHCP